MTYKYRSQRRGNDIRYLPLIPIELHSSKRHLRVRALIDSGAEHTVFSQQIANQLGISLSENRRVMLQTIGGIVPGFLSTIELQLASHRWSTDVIFTDGLAADSGLLGQLGFFQFFTVTFGYSRGDITVRRARSF